MFYHFTNAFQSESTLFSYLNVKELFTRNRRDIWSLSDSNGIRTHNRLFRKRTLSHLAKRPVWLNGWVFVYELSRCGFESRYCHISFCFILSENIIELVIYLLVISNIIWMIVVVFTGSFGVSNVDFEQVNTRWVCFWYFQLSLLVDWRVPDNNQFLCYPMFWNSTYKKPYSAILYRMLPHHYYVGLGSLIIECSEQEFITTRLNKPATQRCS